jgi:two-component system response regulator YesN
MEYDILNVIVVEDEEPIREDLCLFPWEACGALLVGEAGNGREALELCLETPPDIVIADITMPEMDGLTLMEEVRAVCSDTQFVILSCHADFSYAQKALRLGAVDYVVKAGFRESDLMRALDKARERLRAGRRNRRDQRRDQYWRNTSAMREAAVDGRASIPEFARAAVPGRLCTIHCVAQRTDAIFANRHCLDELQSYWPGEWFSPGGGRHSRLVPLAECDGCRETMLGFVNRLQSGVDNSLAYLSADVKFFASISPPVESAEDLKRAVAKLDAYREHVFYEERSLVVFEDYSPTSDATDSQWDELELQLRRAEACEQTLSRYLRNGFLKWARRARINPDQLKSMLISRREAWKRQLNLRGKDDALWTRLSGVWSLTGLSDLVAGELESVGSRLPTQMRPEIARARRMITEEYSKPLTLDAVARHVGWSAPYLSRVFSAEVGKTFKECLTETRVKKAMELLRTPGIKVYEVAERVGFKSYRQFSVVFKGLTGLQPKEFQKGDSDGT